MSVDGEPDDPPVRVPARDMAFGIAVAAFLLWITFFATAGFVEIATLGVAVAMFIWFATVERDRLVDGRRMPHVMLFALAVLAGALVLTSALVFATGTMFLVAALTAGAIVVGLARALSHRYHRSGV